MSVTNAIKRTKYDKIWSFTCGNIQVLISVITFKEWQEFERANVACFTTQTGNLENTNFYYKHTSSTSWSWGEIEGSIPLVSPVGCCGKRLRQQPRHSRARSSFPSGDRPFQCELCPKTFARSQQRKIHMVVHTGERAYLCSECGSSFGSVSTLIDHRKRKHLMVSHVHYILLPF